MLTGAEPDKVGEEKIITTCLNIDIQTVHTQHTSNTIYTYSPAIRKWSRRLQSVQGATCGCPVQSSVARRVPCPLEGFNLFLLHLLFVLSDIAGVGPSVKRVPAIFVIYQGGGGGAVVSPSIGRTN